MEKLLPGADVLRTRERVGHKLIRSVCTLGVFLAPLQFLVEEFNLNGAVELSLQAAMRGPWSLPG